MRDLGVDLIVNVHTSVQMYGKWSNSLCMVHALVSNLNQIPHLSPYIAWEKSSVAQYW